MVQTSAQLAPDVQGASARVVPVFRVIGMVVGLATAAVVGPVAFVLWRVSRRSLGSVPTEARLNGKQPKQQQSVAVQAVLSQCAELAAFLLQLFIQFIQAARHLPSDLPMWMRAPLDLLQVLLFDFQPVHPTCLGTSPLQVQLGLLLLCSCIALMLYAAVAALAVRPNKTLLAMGRRLNVVLLMMYPVAVVTVLDTLDCRTVPACTTRYTALVVQHLRGVLQCGPCRHCSSGVGRTGCCHTRISSALPGHAAPVPPAGPVSSRRLISIGRVFGITTPTLPCRAILLFSPDVHIDLACRH